MGVLSLISNVLYNVISNKICNVLSFNNSGLSAVFIWEDATNYQPTLIVQNTSNRIEVIDNVKIRYAKKQVCLINIVDNIELSNYAIIKGNHSEKIDLGKYILEIPDMSEKNKKYKLQFVVKFKSNNKIKTSIKISREEMLDKAFLQGLCNGN